MWSLTSFMQALTLGLSQTYLRPSDQVQADPETLSASVDLEDIISEYDEPSRRSRLTTSHDETPSRTYFSATSPIEDETTSFYSALYDGFSLDESSRRLKRSQELIWVNSNYVGERETMLQQSDFQISWFNLNYTITPRRTFFQLIDDCRIKFLDLISAASSVFSQCKSRSSYDVNSRAACDAENGGRLRSVSILKNVNGSFRSGELTAVMGPSGAGKTSLLNILSRRREDGFTGQVLVQEASHRVRINAIPQNDKLLECFTVRENLTFASRLKNPYPNQNHEQNVQRVSNLLGLDDCLDTRTKNISGGQQKRLAIAQELFSQPEVLILDEPTSGLDSLTCLKTLSVLKDLLKNSKIAILLTIHQPQQEIFSLFDKVYVMANGGIVIYDGPPASCMAFVEKYSGLKMPHAGYNPASFLIEIASGEFGQEPITALANQVRLEYGKRLERLGRHSPKQGGNNNHSSTIIEGDGSVKGVSNLSLERATGQHYKSELFLDSRLAKSSSLDSGKFFTKTRILTERCWKSTWREKIHMLVRVIFFMSLPFAIAFLMGTDPGESNACPEYYSEISLLALMKTDIYTNERVQEEFLLTYENTGLIFIIIYTCVSANIIIMTLTFMLDMDSCLKEYYNGWYSMNSYVFARLLSNIPIDLVLPTTTIALFYVVTSQNTGHGGEVTDIQRIAITSVAIIMGSTIAQMMGMIYGVIYIGHLTTALFAAQGFSLPFVLLSGFVVRTKNMSQFVRALSMTSLYKHVLEITYIARYGWNVCGCDPKQLQVKEPEMTGVSDRLRTFVKYYMDAQDSLGTSETTDLAQVNATITTPEPADSVDMFQVIAKQLSLYNTYGLEVQSCEDLKPYELNDFALTESDLPKSFMALLSLLLFMLLTLLLVIKLFVDYRTSL